MEELALIPNEGGTDGCGWFAKRILQAAVKHGICLLRSIFCCFPWERGSKKVLQSLLGDVWCALTLLRRIHPAIDTFHIFPEVLCLVEI